MGTDIHYLIQKLEDGKWVTISNDDHPDEGNLYFNNHLWKCEFAFLANVRNSWEVEPLCELRGFPEDLKPYVDEENMICDHAVSACLDGEDFWIGDNNHTWYLVDELLEAGPPILYTRYYVTPEVKASGKTELKSEEYWWSPNEIYSETLNLTDKEEQVSDVLFSYLKELQEKVSLPLRFVMGFDN